MFFGQRFVGVHSVFQWMTWLLSLLGWGGGWGVKGKSDNVSLYDVFCSTAYLGRGMLQFFCLFLWAVCLYHLVLEGMYWNLTGVTWQTVLFAKIVVGRELGWKTEMFKNDKPIIHLPNWKKASLHISYIHRLAFLYCRWQSNWYHFYTKDFLACQKTGLSGKPENRTL